MAELMMPIGHAHDALCDQVADFYNEMLRRGVKELTPKEWVDEFRYWIDAYAFERSYKQTTEHIERYRAEIAGRPHE